MHAAWCRLCTMKTFGPWMCNTLRIRYWLSGRHTKPSKRLNIRFHTDAYRAPYILPYTTKYKHKSMLITLLFSYKHPCWMCLTDLIFWLLVVGILILKSSYGFQRVSSRDVHKIFKWLCTSYLNFISVIEKTHELHVHELHVC